MLLALPALELIPLQVDTLYEAKYYGFALTKGGTNKAMENYSGTAQHHSAWLLGCLSVCGTR